MLTSITIAGEATYPAKGETLTDLKKINYIFGHNGCGKTTISRAIQNPAARLGYCVSWKSGQEIPTLVYNRDFAEANFGEQLKGIFTLGEDSKDAHQEISRLREEIRKSDDKIGGLIRTLNGDDGKGGTREKLSRARSLLEEACWQSQLDHKAHFGRAMTGHRGTKATFCNKVLQEAGNTAELADLGELTARAETIFGGETQTQDPIQLIEFTELHSLENSPTLERRIVGRDGVIIAELIRHLGNSDWVKKGLEYLKSDKRCPFCQQATPESLLEDLSQFFDDQYEKDLAEINQIARRYEVVSKTICAQLESLLTSHAKFLNLAKFTKATQDLKDAFALNLGKLIKKCHEPSINFQLLFTK